MNTILIIVALGVAIYNFRAILDFIEHLRLQSRYTPRTADLYSEHINAVKHEDIPASDAFLTGQLKAMMRATHPRTPCESVLYQIGCGVDELYKQETENRPIIPGQNVLIADGGNRDYVLASLNRNKNFALNLPAFERALATMWTAYFNCLPDDAFDAPERPLAHVDLLETIPDVGLAISNVVDPLLKHDVRDRSLFTEFNHTWVRNVFAASGLIYPRATRTPITPRQYVGAPSETVEVYLRNTALRDLFKAKIPFNFTEMLKEHGLLLAASGWGKSQFIQSLTYYLAQQPDPPTIIVLNSQGSMLDRIQRLSIFAPGQPASDRLVIIDPEDEAAPALNMFSMPTQRMKSYSRNDREQIEAGTGETFEYLFSSVAGDLTGKQTTAFQYLIALILSIDGATFNTFADLLQETTKDPSGKDSKFASDIAKLDETAQGFFRNQYFTKSFTETRQQIGQRMYRVVNRPAFRRMFGSSENRLDLFSLMQRGSVILVNTSKKLLGDGGSAFFGRWFLSLLVRAAYERVAIGNPRRTLLIIDEASDYVDQSFERILSKVRQFNVGCLMAFQESKQIPMLNSVMQNTAVKLVGGVEDYDASVMSRNMRTTPNFLMSMRRTDTATEFAAYVRGKTDTAVRMTVPQFWTLKVPLMSAQQHRQILALNRQRYAATVRTGEPEPTIQPTEEPSELAKEASEAPTSATRTDDTPAPPDDSAHSSPSKEW